MQTEVENLKKERQDADQMKTDFAKVTEDCLDLKAQLDDLQKHSEKDKPSSSEFKDLKRSHKKRGEQIEELEKEVFDLKKTAERKEERIANMTQEGICVICVWRLGRH